MNIKSETEQWQTKYYKNIDTNDPFFVVKLAYFMKTAKKDFYEHKNSVWTT